MDGGFEIGKAGERETSSQGATILILPKKKGRAGLSSRWRSQLSDKGKEAYESLKLVLFHVQLVGGAEKEGENGKKNLSHR